VLGDLEETYRRRAERLGASAARRHLWREVAALALWRMGATLRPPLHPAGRAHAHDIVEPWTGRTTTMGRDLLQDLRFGLRALARRPGFALTAVVVLGLGIGAPTTVLTLVNRIFFDRPPGVTEPHRLVRVWRSWAPGEGGGSLMHPDYAYYRENVTTLEGLAAWGGDLTASYTLDGTRADQLEALCVSDNYFDVLGVAAARGRFFLREENLSPGEDPVAVLSDGFWRRALAADPDVVGRTISMNGITFTVIGVAPPGFRGLSAFSNGPDAWVPLAMFGAMTRTTDRAWWERVPNQRSSWLSVVGRLAPGATFETAEAGLQALSDALTYPERNDGEGIMVTREAIYSPGQSASLDSLSRMLLAVVLIVLAIATANVAVLLLSRATARTREIGIRTAMGAGRGRLFRQLLAESLVLGAAGGVVGVALAYAFSDAAASLLPYTFVGAFTPDARVLAAAVAISVVAATLAGLAPALHAARSDVAASLEGARTAGSRGRARDALVVAQVALSLVLVAGAVLFTRSFWTARTQELGFATEERLVVQVDLRALGYSADEGLAFIPTALDRLRAVPGVLQVATTRMIPFQGDWSTDLDPPPGARSNTDEGKLWVGLNAVSPGYFDVMRVPIARGRALGPEDGAQDPPAVVVNETLETLLWPDEDGLGRTVAIGDDRTFMVVGVARDATYYELGEEPTTQAYASVFQIYQPLVHFLIHTAGPATDWVAPTQAALRELDASLAFGSVTSMGAVFGDVTARFQVSAVLVGLFGALALILAAAGLYGVVSFLVTQRTREIGVRMALGADRARVAREVVRAGLALAAVGVALGLAGTFALRRFTESLLFGVEPGDPWPLVAASVVLVCVSALASLGPARRATRVDPMEAIRSE
jgi:predicted permease